MLKLCREPGDPGSSEAEQASTEPAPSAGRCMVASAAIPEEESEVTVCFSIRAFQACQLLVPPQFRQTVPVCGQDASASSPGIPTSRFMRGQRLTTPSHPVTSAGPVSGPRHSWCSPWRVAAGESRDALLLSPQFPSGKEMPAPRRRNCVMLY